MKKEGAIIIGGGFYGTSIALHLAERGIPATIYESEDRIMSRASYVNQARLHGGYHYPRSFGTAYRSRLNFSRFCQDYEAAIESDFIHVYAIARTNSKVNARQFETFCKNIDAPLRKARPSLAELFEPSLIQAVYEVQEYAFNSVRLAAIMRERLTRLKVEVRCSEAVRKIVPHADGGWRVETDTDSRQSRYVFNCAYSGLNTINQQFPSGNHLKHEITELALVRVSHEIDRLAITVMDGPFFSLMPFPSRDLMTLSHVRYTPHASWIEEASHLRDPYQVLREYPRSSRFPHMMRDAARYMPVLREIEYVDSLFEVKTVLLKNEADDGRPILFEAQSKDASYFRVLGSKIDNIYDALAAVDTNLANCRDTSG